MGIIIAYQLYIIVYILIMRKNIISPWKDFFNLLYIKISIKDLD